MSGSYKTKGEKAIDMHCVVISKAFSGTFFTFWMRGYRSAGKKTNAILALN
jgi:hypothetical protein